MLLRRQFLDREVRDQNHLEARKEECISFRIVKRAVKTPSSEKAVETAKQQIPFHNHSFFKKEIIGDKTNYHTRLMNVYKGWRAWKHKFCVYFINSLNKERKFIMLYPVKEGDAFLGIFYGYGKVKNNPFYRDYTSVCSFSKKIFKTFNKSYFIEFRFKKGSVFLYLHTIAYLLNDRDGYNREQKKLHGRLMELEKEVFKFYGRDLNPQGEGIITKWIDKINQKKLGKEDNPSLLRSLLRSRLRKF
ncbi:DUF226 domain-containing protein (plasmid) [Borreliella burgdorferi]|nr:DUF226 domain-containing protein [Borreliella burgdorferi]MCD2413482.1 DUF226 domain-containing protein [Borreliella burgdorferi]